MADHFPEGPVQVAEALQPLIVQDRPAIRGVSQEQSDGAPAGDTTDGTAFALGF